MAGRKDPRASKFPPDVVDLISEEVLHAYPWIYGEESLGLSKEQIEAIWEDITAKANSRLEKERPSAAIKRRWDATRRKVRIKADGILLSEFLQRHRDHLSMLDGLETRVLKATYPEIHAAISPLDVDHTSEDEVSPDATSFTSSKAQRIGGHHRACKRRRTTHLVPQSSSESDVDMPETQQNSPAVPVKEVGRFITTTVFRAARQTITIASSEGEETDEEHTFQGDSLPEPGSPSLMSGCVDRWVGGNITPEFTFPTFVKERQSSYQSSAPSVGLQTTPTQPKEVGLAAIHECLIEVLAAQKQLCNTMVQLIQDMNLAVSVLRKTMVSQHRELKSLLTKKKQSDLGRPPGRVLRRNKQTHSL